MKFEINNGIKIRSRSGNVDVSLEGFLTTFGSTFLFGAPGTLAAIQADQLNKGKKEIPRIAEDISLTEEQAKVLHTAFSSNNKKTNSIMDELINEVPIRSKLYKADIMMKLVSSLSSIASAIRQYTEIPKALSKARTDSKEELKATLDRYEKSLSSSFKLDPSNPICFCAGFSPHTSLVGASILDNPEEIQHESMIGVTLKDAGYNRQNLSRLFSMFTSNSVKSIMDAWMDFNNAWLELLGIKDPGPQYNKLFRDSNYPYISIMCSFIHWGIVTRYNASDGGAPFIEFGPLRPASFPLQYLVKYIEKNI